MRHLNLKGTSVYMKFLKLQIFFKVGNNKSTQCEKNYKNHVNGPLS